MDRNPYIPLAKVRHCESLSARRAWIEISAWGPHGTGAESLSARRAWIEIWPVAILLISVRVALRKESVDRNSSSAGTKYGKAEVALRKESVDRNPAITLIGDGRSVALRKESVDRNP